MSKPSFPERSAHLSYVAPLIGLVILQQLGPRSGAYALVAVLVMGGLFSAFTGLRWSRKERGQVSVPALLGGAANLLFALGVVVWALGSGTPS